MSTITVKDGTTIYYKDWGPRQVQPIVSNRAQFYRDLASGPFVLRQCRGEYRSGVPSGIEMVS